MVALLGVADDDVVDEGELVGVDASAAQVLLSEALLADVGLAVLAGGVAPTIQQRLAEAFDAEDLLVGVLAVHQEPRLVTGVQAVVHAVLWQTVGDGLGGLQVDIDMHVLDVDVERLHRAFGHLGELHGEAQGLAVGDPPRLDVVVGRVVHGHGDVLTRDLRGNRVLAALQIVGEARKLLIGRGDRGTFTAGGNGHEHGHAEQGEHFVTLAKVHSILFLSGSIGSR